MRARKLANNTVLIAIGMIWLVISGAPFYFMAMTGFKERFELFTGDVFAFPQNPTFGNYDEVLTGGSFFSYVTNSMLIVFVSVALILVISSMAAYVFSRMKFRLNRPLFGLIIAGLVIPVHITLIPVYLFTRDVGLYDSLWGLLGPYVAFNLPLSIFILTEFMRGIPREMEEAAYIDGCGPMRAFVRIIMPLSMSGLATLAIYNSVVLWNEFVFAFVLITSPKNQTLPLAIWEYQGQYSMNIPAIMSVLTLSALPLILIYMAGQEKVLRGMMAGALK